MAPLLVLGHTADGEGWDNLSQKGWCRWQWMDPALLSSQIADDIGWAHCFWEGMLLIPSSRPSDTDEPCYRWHGVGLVCITTETADDLEWAQCCYSVMMPLAWGGPIASHKICGR